MTNLNSIFRYFDLFSNLRDSTPYGRAGSKNEPPSNLWLCAQYGSLYLGILAKVFLDSLDSLESASDNFTFSWVRLLLAAITATAVFPAVYKEAMETSGPSIVQCCVTFAAGLGYKTLIDVEV